MKKNTLNRILSVFILLPVLVIQNSCLDKKEVIFMANVPVYLTYEELRSPIAVENSRTLNKPGKIYFKDNYIYINEVNKGIHIINNADPSQPLNMKFIPLPGNVDIAIKDHYLYADSYVDLLVLDISDLNNIKEKKRINGIFEYTLPPTNPDYPTDQVDYEKGIVVDWKIEKVVREEQGNHYPYPIGPLPWFAYEKLMTTDGGWINNSSGTVNFSASGTGGSMTRFIVYDTYLYMVSSYNIKIYNLSSPENPAYAGNLYGGWGLETVFIADNHMYIGSQNGMDIYSLANPYNPVKLGAYSHITSCDPVVVEGNYAYVTLRSGTRCGSNTNQLDVVDISNKTLPTRIRSYLMENPHGLGIEDSILFVCDGTDGLKIYDAGDVYNINSNLIKRYPDIHAFDVIPMNGTLFLIGDDGLYQYDYSDPDQIYQLSVIQTIKQEE